MNNIGDESPICIPWNIRYYDISDVQFGHANPGASDSDVVSSKMREAVIQYYNSVQSR